MAGYANGKDSSRAEIFSLLMKNPKRIFLFTIVLALTLSPRAISEDTAGYKGQVETTDLLKTTTTAADQPIVYPQTAEPEVSILLVEIPPGGATGWHKHPYPIFAYALSGELSIEFEDGRSHHLSAGEAMVECLNMFHNGTNIGTVPVKIVISVMGEKGKPFTLHKE